MSDFKVTVIGAGHGGKAMAAHLTKMGVQTTLCNRSFDRIRAIHDVGGVEIVSDIHELKGFVKLNRITADFGEALQDADLIMVVVPSTAHAEIAEMCAPHLKDGQVVVLNPGKTLGSLEFAHVLKAKACCTDIRLAEAENFMYAARSEGPAKVRIFRVTDSIPLAALPAKTTPEVLAMLHRVYPQYIDGGNVLQTGLNSMSSMFHPALMLFNAGWIEATHGNFDFYYDGATRGVSKILEVVDRERVTVASALGIRARTGLEWLKLAYSAEGESLYDAMQDNAGYVGIKAPKQLNHRYIFEDVPMSMVPIASLGKRYGVSVKGIEAIIQLTSILHNTDYWRRGRTVQSLGIEQYTVDELTELVNDGVWI